jgi:hypothetical protein
MMQNHKTKHAARFLALRIVRTKRAQGDPKYHLLFSTTVQVGVHAALTTPMNSSTPDLHTCECAFAMIRR